MTVTIAQLQERIDEQVLAQLTDPGGATVNVTKLGHALADALGTIRGYLFKLPVADQPPAETLDAHQVALALYVLAGNRPGVEFDSIRSRAKVAIAYLEQLTEGTSVGVDTEIDAPSPLVDTDSLSLFQGNTTT